MTEFTLGQQINNRASDFVVIIIMRPQVVDLAWFRSDFVPRLPLFQHFFSTNLLLKIKSHAKGIQERSDLLHIALGEESEISDVGLVSIQTRRFGNAFAHGEGYTSKESRTPNGAISARSSEVNSIPKFSEPKSPM